MRRGVLGCAIWAGVDEVWQGKGRWGAPWGSSTDGDGKAGVLAWRKAYSRIRLEGEEARPCGGGRLPYR